MTSAGRTAQNLWRAGLSALFLLSACRDVEAPRDLPAPERPTVRREPIEALPAEVKVDGPRAELGEQLFRDRTLSADGSIACVDCHLFDHGGADGQALSPMSGGRRTAFNAPSIFNLAFDFRFSWTGAFTTIDEQLDAAFERTMNVRMGQILGKLEKTHYAADFKAQYGDGLTEANLRDALVQFLRSLVTPDARFDRFLAGDRSALDAEEQAGYLLFKDLGCTSCHQGVNVGGNLYQRMGVAEDYFTTRGGPLTDADLGRFKLTQDPADKHVFRVPSLRNVEKTAPYFHDGSAKTLDDAIATMARFQLGREVEAKDRARIAAFLRTLTGARVGGPRPLSGTPRGQAL
jgi:cytochrome c peroxidase